MVKTTKPKSLEIMKHNLVPNHVIISDKEKNELLKKYNITPDQLPKILYTDPVSKHIGAEPGQIIKIIRKSHTATESVAYRFVVESNG